MEAPTQNDSQVVVSGCCESRLLSYHGVVLIAELLLISREVCLEQFVLR